ncbi:MAG: YraN family protein [Clostridiales bacterium]|jgi:putative endonuclease|nr:YraN family protein [Clostridiales bacterium]
MENKVALGAYGQRLAEDYLKRNGFSIIERNYRSPSGEIDLIVRDNFIMVFVEVKYRSSIAFGYPREAVNYRKQQKIRGAAMFYIMKKALVSEDYRFDVVEVLNENSPRITHIINAF